MSVINFIVMYVTYYVGRFVGVVAFSHIPFGYALYPLYGYLMQVSVDICKREGFDLWGKGNVE